MNWGHELADDMARETLVRIVVAFLLGAACATCMYWLVDTYDLEVEIR